MSTSIKPFNEQGCSVCRTEWLSGTKGVLRHLGTNIELHAHLYQCTACGAYWEGLERYACEVLPQKLQSFSNPCKAERTSGSAE